MTAYSKKKTLILNVIKLMKVSGLNSIPDTNYKQAQTIKELFNNTKATFKKIIINIQIESPHLNEHRATINIRKLNKRNKME